MVKLFKTSGVWNNMTLPVRKKKMRTWYRTLTASCQVKFTLYWEKTFGGVCMDMNYFSKLCSKHGLSNECSWEMLRWSLKFSPEKKNSIHKAMKNIIISHQYVIHYNACKVWFCVKPLMSIPVMFRERLYSFMLLYSDSTCFSWEKLTQRLNSMFSIIFNTSFRSNYESWHKWTLILDLKVTLHFKTTCFDVLGLSCFSVLFICSRGFLLVFGV